MFRKKIICFGIILFLLVAMVLAQETEEEKEKRLKEIGFQFGEDGIVVGDIDIEKEYVVITEIGSKKQIDLSKIKGKRKIKLPHGAVLEAAPDILSVSFAESKSENNIYYFVKGHKDIEVVDGKIVIENVELGAGSVIKSSQGDLEIKGQIANIGGTGGDVTMTSQEGKSITINGFTFNPSNNDDIFYINGDINSKGKEVSVTDSSGDFVGIFKGFASFKENEIMLHAHGEDPGEFTNEKGTKIKTTRAILISKGKSSRSDIDKIEYNGDFVISTRVGSQNKVEIESKDGDYENFITKKIVGQASVDLTLENKVDGKTLKTLFKFSEKPPLVKGDISKLQSNMGHVFSAGRKTVDVEATKNIAAHKALVDVDKPWAIYNGKEITGKEIGEITSVDPFGIVSDIKDKELRNLVVKSTDISSVISTFLFESASKQIKGDKGLQDLFVNKIIEERGVKDIYLDSLLELAENNPEAQKRVIEGLNKENKLSSSGLLDSLANLPDFENQRLLLDKYNSYIDAKDARKIFEFSDNAKLKALVSPKINGILDVDKFKSLSDVEKRKVLENTNFFSSYSTAEGLKETTGNNELQNLILDKSKGRILRDTQLRLMLQSVKSNPEAQKRIMQGYRNIGIYSDWTSIKIRELIRDYDPSIVSGLLSKTARSVNRGRGPGWDSAAMADIYSDSEFLLKTKDMDNVDRWNIGMSISRRIDQLGGGLNSESINKFTDEVISLREANEDRILIGPDTTFIPVTNDEKWEPLKDDKGNIVKRKWGDERFQEDRLIEFAKDSDVKDSNIVKGLKGPNKKSDILNNIEGSKGSTTIYFSNHGGRNHQWLTQGQPGTEVSDKMKDPRAISYIELGDSLVQRAKKGESLSNVNIITDSCYSYDFTKNLYSYLQYKGKEEGIINSLPTVSTITNRGQMGYGFDPLLSSEAVESGIYDQGLYAFSKTKAKGQPLTVGDVFKAQRLIFKYQDGAVFIPGQSGVDVIGSSYDDVVPIGEPDESVGEKTEPSYIEISKVELWIQESLYV